MTSVSLIICTRNRADEISNCLSAVGLQASGCDDVEVIVVDNGSTDATKEVVDQVSKNIGYPFIYVYEPIAGLCQARNRGRDEAIGDILAYIDDDVIIGENWITGVRSHFVQAKSDCLAGKVTATLDGQLPFPMDDSMLWFFQATMFGERPRPLVHPEHPIGCNMAFKASVFDQIGGFNTNLKLYGDETEFFRRVAEKKFSVWYESSIIVDQVIPQERLTREAIRSKSYNWGVGAATLWLLTNSGNAGRAIIAAKYAWRSLLLFLALRFKESFGKFFTYWYYRGYLSRIVEFSRKADQTRES